MEARTHDPVDTFRRIALLLLKWVLYCLLALLLLVAGIAGFAVAYQWFTYDQHAAKIIIAIKADKDACKDAALPLFIGFTNNSTKVLERVYFDVAARRKGRSTDITKSHSFEHDHIIGPGRGIDFCWRLPPLEDTTVDPYTLEWSIKYKRFTFRD